MKDLIGIVVIGRNEGDRLVRCLNSIPKDMIVIYVDSGSSDGSVLRARQLGVNVLELDRARPFTAARARNAGFKSIVENDQRIRLIQFIDADCEMATNWFAHATTFLQTRIDVGIACGRLREAHPDRSIYNWLCGKEWDAPIGEIRSCGGIAIFRRETLEQQNGFREDLIAGEEPELCLRCQRNGWKVWRLDIDMASHDASIITFFQWWRRAQRSGYAYANGAFLHGFAAERHFIWETLRPLVWTLFLPIVCFTLSLVLWPWGLISWSIFPVQILRQVCLTNGTFQQRLLLAAFQMLSRFAETQGQFKFWMDRLYKSPPKLIEHK